MMRSVLYALSVLVLSACSGAPKGESTPRRIETKLARPGYPDAYEGFKVESVEPGSVYDRAGVEKGDIIKAINGQKIRTSADALAVYQQMQRGKNVEFLVLRSNQELVLAAPLVPRF